MSGPTMQQVLDRAAEIYPYLPEDGKEVFYSRLVKEVDHTLERYAFFIPQTSVEPEDAVEKLGLTPPVEDEEVVVTPPGAVVGLTTTPALDSFAEEGVVDLKGEAVVETDDGAEKDTEDSEDSVIVANLDEVTEVTEDNDVVSEGSDESEPVSEASTEPEVTVPEENKGLPPL